MAKNLTEALNRMPPFLCRIAARSGSGPHQKPKSHAEISKESGISKAYVAQLSKRTTWKNVTVDIVERFSKACGVDILAPNETIDFLRASKMEYLHKATPQQRKLLKELFTQRSESARKLSV